MKEISFLVFRGSRNLNTALTLGWNHLFCRLINIVLGKVLGSWIARGHVLSANTAVGGGLMTFTTAGHQNASLHVVHSCVFLNISTDLAYFKVTVIHHIHYKFKAQISPSELNNVIMRLAGSEGTLATCGTRCLVILEYKYILINYMFFLLFL